MLSKSFAAFILLVLTSSVNANVAFNPPLGGAISSANDVLHPVTGSLCGGISVPQNIDSSSCIQADTSGAFTVPFENFGSAAPTISEMQVNADGTGNSFVSGQIPTVGSSQLTAQLPSGTKCTGGPNKDRCVVSIVAADRSGNCVLVQQPSTGTSDSNPAAASPSPSPNPQGTVKANDGSADNGNKANTGNGNKTDTTNGTTSNKVNQRSRNFKRVHAQGKRL